MKRSEHNIEGGERGSTCYMDDMWFTCGLKGVSQQIMTAVVVNAPSS